VAAVPESVACGKRTPGAGVIPPAARAPEREDQSERRSDVTIARVGHEAPDFKAMGYFNGEFKEYRLSDYRGQWVVLCFYPGDFTFV